MRRDTLGRIIGYNWWRDLVVSSWQGAHEHWLDQREANTLGYETEEKLYDEEHHQPTLKEYMIGLKFKE